jgi:hypothetical protein
MPRTARLNEQASVKLNAGGTGTAQLVPSRLETWTVTRIAVSASSNTLEPVAQVYVASVSPGNLLAGTYTGSLDSSDENQVLSPQEPLLCVWTGGDVGATATLSVFGTREFTS